MKLFITIVMLTLNIFAFTPDDIKSMRDFGILVSLNDIDKPSKISEKMTPKEFLNVTYLNFNKSAIYNLPEWITHLTKLKGLDLNGAKINLDELKKISTLTKLTVLNLDKNNLFDGVTDSKKLMSILSNFDLNELSLSNTGGNLCNYANIGSLNSLVELKLAHNNLNNISDKNCTLELIGLNKLDKLEVLDLSNNQISGDFEAKFLPFETLVKLNLSANNIQNFKYYKPLPRLESLDLSKNSNLKIAPNYGGLFAMQKLVHLKRESNIKVPDGLKNRLDKAQKSIEEENNLKYKGILKKLGLEKNYGYLKEEFYTSSITNIPNGSILFLKKDLNLKRNDSLIGNCTMSYRNKYKYINFLTDNITIKSQSKLIIRKIDNNYGSGRIKIFFQEGFLSNIICSQREYHAWSIDEFKKEINSYFDIFIKK